MRRLLIIGAVAAVTLLAVPALASASYTISKSEAQSATRGIAKQEYGYKYGIHRVVARCRPQGVPFDPHYTYHRWVCGWAGLDYEGDVASGRIRVTGHSSGSYGYIVLAGIRWQ